MGVSWNELLTTWQIRVNKLLRRGLNRFQNVDSRPRRLGGQSRPATKEVCPAFFTASPLHRMHPEPIQLRSDSFGIVPLRARSLLLLLSSWLLISCQSTALTSVVEDVQPRELITGLTDTLTLTGHFYPQLTISTSNGQEIENRAFTGVLRLLDEEGNATSSVISIGTLNYVSTEVLTVVPPSGLEPGMYRLELLDPRGGSVNVPSSIQIEVPAVKPDHASLSASSRYLAVGSSITLTVGLVNTDGSVASLSGVEVGLELYSLTVQVTPLVGLNTKVETLEDGDAAVGVKVTGQTNEAGILTVSITNTEPESFDVRSRAPDLPHYEPDESFRVTGLSSNYSTLLVLLPGQVPSDVNPDCAATATPSPTGEAVEGSGDDTVTITAGSPFQVTVTAIDEDCEKVNELSADFELLDTETGEEAPLFSPGTTSVTLNEGSWSSYLQYNALMTTRLLAIGPDQKYAFSTEFEIVPGPARELNVTLLDVPEGGELIAGVAFRVQAIQLDAYQNPVPFKESASFAFSDETGTLTCGHSDVAGAVLTLQGCTVTHATTSTRILVNDVQGKQGFSEPIAVRSGPAEALRVHPPTNPAMAGEAFEIVVEVVDGWGNLVPDSEAELDFVVAQLYVDGFEYGTASDLVVASGTAKYSSLLNSASSEVWLTVHSDVLGLSAQGEPFSVAANSATSIQVNPCPDISAPCQWVAGTPSPVLISIFDKFGNPVLDFSGTVKLSSNLETLDSAQSTLTGFENGMLRTNLMLTRSGETVLSAVSGQATGQSQPFEVDSGDFANVVAVNVAPIYWKNETFSLTVMAVDAYGNRVYGRSDKVKVQDEETSLALEGGSPPRGGIQLQLDDGAVEAAVQLTAGAHENLLTVSLNGNSSKSSPFEVYVRGCTPANQAILTANGQTDRATVCMTNHVGAGITGRVEFAISGNPALSSYLLLPGDGVPLTGVRSESLTHDYLAVGNYDATLYVADANYCASQVTVPIYVGSDDGSAVGPLQLSASQTTLLASAADDSGKSTVTVQAYDCQGDAATSQELIHVIGNMGSVMNTDQDDTRLGLQLRLDRRGQLAITYSVVNEPYGGESTLVLEAVSGLASGVQKFTITNDLVPPFALEHWPSGIVNESVSEIRIWFSEALRGGDALLFPSISVVSELHGVVPIASRTLASEGRELILTLAQPLPLDGEDDRIDVTLPSGRNVPSLTDLDGNRLDGDWNGVADDSGDPFVFRFGSKPMTPFSATMTRCDVSPLVFSPDGREGTNGEEETVLVEAEIVATQGVKAVALRLEDVTTEAAVDWNVRALKPSSLSADVAFVWDGTGLDGRVLPNGTFSLQILVVDEDGLRIWLPCPTLDGLVLANSVDLGGYP